MQARIGGPRVRNARRRIGSRRRGAYPHSDMIASSLVDGSIRRLNAERTGKTIPAAEIESEFQNASAGSSIRLAAPDWMRARCVAVSGSMRSMKKRPVTSFAVMRASAPAASFACAALAMRHHM